jgi:hypothetical protein
MQTSPLLDEHVAKVNSFQAITKFAQNSQAVPCRFQSTSWFGATSFGLELYHNSV